MTNSTKYIIVGLSVLSAAGIGYFVYSRIRIGKLNKKITTISQAYQEIAAVDVSDVHLTPGDITTEPDVPLYSGDSDEIGYGGGTYVAPEDPAWDDFFDSIWNTTPTGYIDNEGTELYTDHG
jgi:hypothetical protein